jgi:glycine cleavage system H protein
VGPRRRQPHRARRITDYAQGALGDIVYVSLPGIGTAVTAGQPMGEGRVDQSVSDVFAPVAGTVLARNDALESQPELLNSDPYGEGWIVEIEVADLGVVNSLLDADAVPSARRRVLISVKLHYRLTLVERAD